MKRLYCPFSKSEEAEDGTLKVWGYASTGTEDEDGETILPEAIKAALPDYLKWGAVREMHQPKAVGTAIEADVQPDGRTWFGAHVVDPVAVKKIQNKVLKGFSVGGRITERDEVEKSTITGIKLIEVSLVDRPANPECEITMIKRSPEAAIDDLAALLKSNVVDPETLLDAALEKKDDNGKKPYGDVEYADPGYQEDGKKRYPIDTEAHIRAAWNYINKEKNQAQYTAAQVKRIKAKIIAAWKKKIDKDGPPSADEKVAKSLYDVSSFCQALEALAWVCAGAQSDFDWEGDGSPIPEKLRACMADLADIFAEMAEEEASELVDQLKAQAGEAIERLMKGNDMSGLQIGDALKAGAKFSKETREKMAKLGDHLESVHKACKDLAAACKDACAMHKGIAGDEPEDHDEDDGEKLARAAKAAKAAADAAATAAAALKGGQEPQATELAKVIGEAIEARLAPMAQLVEALARQPVGGTPITGEVAAALKRMGLAAVNKGANADPNAAATGDPAELGDFAPVTLAGGSIDEGATMVKALLHPSRRKYDVMLGGGDSNLAATQIQG
jgi:hypothetical protein